jgi:hypothetical protein
MTRGARWSETERDKGVGENGPARWRGGKRGRWSAEKLFRPRRRFVLFFLFYFQFLLIFKSLLTFKLPNIGHIPNENITYIIFINSIFLVIQLGEE